MLLGEERAAVAAGGDRLAAAGLVVGAAGNLSALAADGRLLAVTPSGLPVCGLRSEDITVVDRQGRVVDGHRAPTSEVPLHLAVYAAGGTRAVAHTHAPASTAVACSLAPGGELPALHYACVQLGGPPRLAPYATFGTQALAGHVATALAGGRRAALMANHGSLAVGATVAEACDHLVLLEWLCEVQVRAAVLGGGRPLTAAQLADAAAAFASRRYGQPDAATAGDQEGRRAVEPSEP